MGLITGKAILQGSFSTLHGFVFPWLSSDSRIRERGHNEGRWLQALRTLPATLLSNPAATLDSSTQPGHRSQPPGVWCHGGNYFQVGDAMCHLGAEQTPLSSFTRCQ